MSGDYLLHIAYNILGFDEIIIKDSFRKNVIDKSMTLR